MSAEFINFGDRIINKAELASQPLILDDLKQTTARFLDLAREAAEEEDVSDPTNQDGREREDFKRARTELMSGSQTNSTPLFLTTTDPSSFSGLMLAATPQLSSHAIRQITPDSRAQMIAQSTGNFSPRHGYGMLSTSLPPSYPHPNAESPFLSYVISGPRSFAMRLYVDTISLIFNILRGTVFVPGYIPRVGQYRLRHERPQNLMEKVRYQLNKMGIDANDTDAYIESPNSTITNPDSSLIISGPSDYEILDVLMLKIVRDYTQERGNLGEWFDPWSTQQYLVNHWGFHLSSTTARITSQTLQALNAPIPEQDSEQKYFAAGTGFEGLENNGLVPERWWDSEQPSLNDIPQVSIYEPQGPPVFGQGLFPSEASDVDVRISAKQMARKLGFHAMCFGDGPRFSKAGIDQVVRELLAEMSLPPYFGSRIMAI